MEILVVITVVLVLLIAYCCASTFSSIACMKGHDDRKYFWWTFFIPLLGALMVLALPDRSQTERVLPVVPTAGIDRVNSQEAGFSTTPSKAPAADMSDSTPVVTPRGTDKEDQIECPICGKLQRANRTVCWECGAKFNRE